jgi:hypothetical protein
VVAAADRRRRRRAGAIPVKVVRTRSEGIKGHCGAYEYDEQHPLSWPPPFGRGLGLLTFQLGDAFLGVIPVHQKMLPPPKPWRQQIADAA